MVWRFLKHYGMTKANGLLDDFASAVVAFDPETASQAQVKMMEVELGKLGERLAEAENELHREHQETLDLKQAYEQHLQAAQILERKLSGTENTAPAEAALSKVLDKLERMKPEIEREEREDSEVEAWRGELRQAFESLAKKIRDAQVGLKTAHRQMEVAQLQKDRAEEHDRRTKEVFGLTGSIGSLSVALDAMNQETAKVRNETEVLKLKAGLLQSDGLDGDPVIAAALAEARGTAARDRGSLSARLAALGGKEQSRDLTTAA